jgi:hypothetical protein
VSSFGAAECLTAFLLFYSFNRRNEPTTQRWPPPAVGMDESHPVGSANEEGEKVFDSDRQGWLLLAYITLGLRVDAVGPEALFAIGDLEGT